MTAKVSRTIRTAKPAPKVPALQINAVNALGLTPENLTADGIHALQRSVVGGTAKVALAVYVSPVTAKMPERALGEFLGTSHGTAGNVRRAGAILARCGASAKDETLAANTLALVAGGKGSTFDGKSGAALVKAIGTAYKAFRQAENTKPARRGPGKMTASERAAAEAKASERADALVAKASNAQRIEGALRFLGAVIKSGATDVTESQVAELFAQVTTLSALVAAQGTTDAIAS